MDRSAGPADLASDDEMSSVRRSRLSRTLAVLATIFTLAIGLFIANSEGPYYNKNRSDPSYAYLFNALDIEQGIAPFVIHHPGTTVQLIGAGVLRFKWWMESQISSQPPIVTSVLLHPEEYLHAINLVLLLLIAATIGVATKRIHELTGQAGLPLIVPSLLLVSASALGATGQVQPEPLVIPLAMAITLLAIPRNDRSSAHLYFRAALFGIALGAGIVTKVTFAPLMLLIFVFSGLLAVLIAGISTLITASILLLPIFAKLFASYEWFKALITHQGYYGGGPEGIAPLDKLLSAALDLIGSEPLIAVGTLVAAIGFLCVRFLGAASANPSWSRFYLAAVAVCIAQLLIVAKHAMPRYLLPGLASAAIFIPLALYHINSRMPFTARAFAGAVLLAVAAGLFVRATDISVVRYRTTQMDQKEAVAIQAIAAEMDCRIIPYYRASGLDYALTFGEYWGGSSFAKQLAALYPELVNYNPGSGLFEAFGSMFSDPAARMGNRQWCLIGDYDQGSMKFPNAEIKLKRQIGESLMVVIKPAR